MFRISGRGGGRRGVSFRSVDLGGGLATRRGGGDCLGTRGGGIRVGLAARGGGVPWGRAGRSSAVGLDDIISGELGWSL